MSNSIFWLSFVDHTKPAGDKFAGVAIVQADDFQSAVLTAWQQDINPGGEVAGCELPSAVHDLVRDCVGRLLSKDEASSLNDQIIAASATKH